MSNAEQLGDDHEVVRFQGLETLALEDTGAGQALRCTLPARVVTTNQRQTVRIPIAEGLQTSASLRVFADQQPIRARLLDLSAEGCLMEMPIGAGMLFTPDQPVTELGIEGPDGDRIAVKAWVMALDDRAQPARVRLVRNLAGRERPMNEILEGRYLAQLGALEGPVEARDYGLAPF